MWQGRERMARTEIWLRLMYVGDLYGEAMLNIRLFASLR
ncbi:hypothetical protein LTSEINV_4951 [Salmonella enterica subsp. enterica serovar Inverness str. R8-3668]|uniref:Smf/DprA SAM domain-containing protein n=1 Tax=Salmonella enterica subsp. enterica serovar Inverness str. R8-3668 TaxID=913075 RepID=G5NIU0_SALET|nr:hypothetical protein LTSEINV_4951 [Salmonella enterica subsp. enterica serovar Inverness str. R8-3668]